MRHIIRFIFVEMEVFTELLELIYFLWEFKTIVGRGRNDMVFTDLALEDVGNTYEEEDKMEEVGIGDIMRTTTTHIV